MALRQVLRAVRHARGARLSPRLRTGQRANVPGTSMGTGTGTGVLELHVQWQQRRADQQVL